MKVGNPAILIEKTYKRTFCVNRDAKHQLKPAGHWKSSQNVRQFFEDVSRDLGVCSPADWGLITKQKILERGGGGMIDAFGGSVRKALEYAYPEVSWSIEMFPNVPSVPTRYWLNPDNRRKFLDSLKEELGISRSSDWGKITVEQMRSKGGIGFLNHFDGSLFKALQSVYPEEIWSVHDFPNAHKVSHSYWKDLKNQRQFLDDLAAELHIQHPKDWGYVTRKIVEERGGLTLLSYCGDSLLRALQTVYPETKWNVADFPTLDREPSGYWNNVENQRNFFDKLGKELNIQTVKDWGRVTKGDVQERRGGGLLSHFGHNLYNALRSAYPEFGWSGNKYVDLPNQTHISKGQQKLWDILQPLIGDLQMNYRHPSLIRKDTLQSMEVDLWSESLKLAVEYQGLQHYASKFPNITAEYQQKRDLEKRSACARAGITLVEVPYWWKGDRESLLATIHRERPDVLHHVDTSKFVPISQVPPLVKKRRRSNALKI
eukprot:TRINITY_DN7146_c0_g1_i1.p1 TRINITY_DN7146_c0_g1~~TRINITY_DN7146_c0_g1_i1.p1  ORF type:complete len:487 (-),score=70.02 TRINITY_DN7146_c0_g1_i1:20-1480(-)